MVKRSKFILLLVAVLLLALVFTGCKWGKKNPNETDAPETERDGPLVPDYPLPPVESGAESMEEDDTGKLESPEGGGSVGLEYTVKAYLSLSDGNFSIMFANPSRSNKDIVVSLSIQGNIVARSGLLKPGNRITRLSLGEDGASKVTQPGVYEGKYIVDFYDPLSGEKAIVNTEIPITITAQ